MSLLKDKVRALEAQVKVLQEKNEIAICGGKGGFIATGRTIPVREVVEQLLDHLGLTLKYTLGREASVRLERKGKEK